MEGKKYQPSEPNRLLQCGQTLRTGPALNPWTCLGTWDELTLPEKWTVNIILQVILLLLYRRLQDLAPAFLPLTGGITLCSCLPLTAPATEASIFGYSNLLDEGSHMSIFHRIRGCLIPNRHPPVSPTVIKDDLMTDERHQIVITLCRFSTLATNWQLYVQYPPRKSSFT